MAAPTPTNVAHNAASWTASKTQAYASNPTVGSVLCVVLWGPASGAAPSEFAVSDDRNGSYTLHTPAGCNDGDPQAADYINHLSIWTVVATSALATTVTVARGAGAKVYAFTIFEVTGPAASSPIEDHNKIGYGQGTSASVDMANTTAAETVVIGAVRTNDSSTLTPAANWTELWELEDLGAANELYGGGSIIYRQATSAGQAYDPTWSLGTSRDWGAVGLIVKAASAASSPASLATLGVG